MLNTFENNLSSWLQPKDKFISVTKHLIPFFDYVSDDILLNEWELIQSLVADIDTLKFIEWDQWAITNLTNQYATGPGGHILDAGHAAVAEKVIVHIKNNDSN